MASILENSAEQANATEPAARIDAAEFDEAQRDPRVRDFLADAGRYLAELERSGRNR
jgi:hypothetical protein